MLKTVHPSAAPFPFRRRVLAAAAVALPLLLGSSLAQVTISGPRSLEMTPGETRTVEYTIGNPGDRPVQASVFTNDYLQRSDGSLAHVPARSLPQSLFRLLGFERVSFTIPAKGSVVVPARLTVPKDAAGGYWGVVGAETPAPPSAAGTVGIQLRYAMVTALEVKGTVRRQITLENLAVSRAANGDNELNVAVANAGNAYERYQLAVVYRGVGGQPVREERQMVVLPGATVDLVLPVPKDLPAGSYGAFVTASYQGGRAEAVGSFEVRR